MAVALQLPSAVMFDMDGLLVDTEPIHAETYCRIFTEMGLKLSAEEYRQAINIGLMDVDELFYSIGGREDKWQYVCRQKAQLFTELINENAVLLPGVLDLLESLKKERVPTALCTSAGNSTLVAIMGKFDLQSYFDVVVTWQDVQATKPAPDSYLEGARRLGVNASECVALEDSPRGALAAHYAGMKCIAVPTVCTGDGDFSTAAMVVKSLEEVSLPVMRGLFPAHKSV